MSFETIKLGRIGEFRNGLNYSKASFGHGLKVISVKDFGDRWRPDVSTLDEIDPAGLRVEQSDLRAGDILFVRSNGNKELVGRSMLIEETLEDVSFSGFCIRFRPTATDVNSKFLSLFFRTRLFRRTLSQEGKGTNINNLSQPILERMEVPWPSKPVQEGIVAVASTYDDLIENNLRRIGLLEKAARLLYREWFVFFRFPGHEHIKLTSGVPQGWERKPFGEIAELQYGKALKEEKRVDGPFPVYGSSGIVGTHQVALVEGPAIIVGRKGNVGSVRWSPVNFWPIDTVYFVPKDQSNYWLYHALHAAGFQNTDGGVPGLNRDFAYSRRLTCPPTRLRRSFNEYVAPMFEQSNTLESYNQKLAAARDLLLPRLLNGEIAV